MRGPRDEVRQTQAFMWYGTSHSTSREKCAGTVSRGPGKNMLYAAAAWLVPSAAAFFAIPVTVRGLGAYGYGVLALVGAVSGLLYMMDMGLGQGIVRYVAMFVARRNGRAIRECLGFALAWSVAVGVLGTGALWLLSPWLSSVLLGAPALLQVETTTAFRIGAVAFGFNMVALTLSPVPQSFLRYDIVAVVSGSIASVSLVGPAVLVSMGYGLLPVLWFGVGVSMAACLAWGLAALRLARLVPNEGPGFGGPRIEFIRFSLTGALNQIVSVADLQIGRLVVAVAGGAAQVAYFQVPSVLAAKVRELMNRMAMVLLPTGSQMAAEDNHAGIVSLYERASRLLFVVNASVASAIIVFSLPLLTYWVAVDFGKYGALALSLLTLAGAVNATSMAASYLNLALGRPRVNLAFSSLNSLVSLSLVYLLTVRFGIAGTALTALLASLMAPFFLHYSHRRVLRVSSWRVFRDCYARTILGVFLVAAVSWLLLLPLADALPVTLVLVGLVALSGMVATAGLGGITKGDWRALRLALRAERSTAAGREDAFGSGADGG
jgi:O-antigen/teichoic acid export membrane protein